MRLWHRAKSRADLIIATLAGLACFALYAKTLAPTLLMADAAEFQLACHLLGVAHPTGYPLYLMLGWLWSHLLPIGDAAYRINLLSSVFSATAIGLAYPLTLRILKVTLPTVPRNLLRAVAVIAGLTLAFSRTFWSQALRAEVYALNSLFVVATLFLLLLWSYQERRSSRTLYAAALVYGLSLAHHRTMILLLPAYVLFVWLTDRSALTSVKSLGRLILAMLVPQLLYLYIPLRAPATPYLHLDLAPGRTLELYDNSMQGFLGFVLGAVFRGELGYQAPLLERMTMAGASLLRQFGTLGVGLGLLGLVRLGIGRQKATERRGILLLLGLSYLGLVAFCLFYFIGDVHVLFTPSFIIFGIWIAVGIGWVVEAAALVLRRWPRAWPAVAWALILWFGLLPLSLVLGNYHQVDMSDRYQARQWAEEILAQRVPDGAILVSNDRNEITPLLYVQYVEGIRPDLLTMFPLMLPGEEYSNVVRVIDSVIDLERPLYLVKSMPGLEVKYRMEPSDTLVQVTGPAAASAPQNSTDLALEHTLVLVGYDMEPARPSPGDESRVALYWQVEKEPAEDYHSYVHLVDEGGNILAQSDQRPGGEYYPTSLWQPGETLLDRHTLAIPTAVPRGDYRLVVGMYVYPSMEALGEALTLGEVTVSGRAPASP